MGVLIYLNIERYIQRCSDTIGKLLNKWGASWHLFKKSPGTVSHGREDWLCTSMSVMDWVNLFSSISNSVWFVCGLEGFFSIPKEIQIFPCRSPEKFAEQHCNSGGAAGLQLCPKQLPGDGLHWEIPSLLLLECKGSIQGFSPSPQDSRPKQAYPVGFVPLQYITLKPRASACKQGLASIHLAQISDKRFSTVRESSACKAGGAARAQGATRPGEPQTCHQTRQKLKGK